MPVKYYAEFQVRRARKSEGKLFPMVDPTSEKTRRWLVSLSSANGIVRY